MHLSAATIQEFKEICQDEFGLVLSDDEAAVHASRVLQLIWMLVVESQHSSGSDRSCAVD